MAYIGSQPSDLNSGAKPRNDFTGDGTTTAFTLSQSVPGGFESNVIVIVDNVIQQPVEAYTIGGSNYTTLQFTEAPALGAVVYVLHQGNATNFIAPSLGSVGASALADNLRNFTVDSFTGNGSTVAFTLTDTPVSVNSILVIVDGIIQAKTTNYTLTTNVLTFTGAPDSGSAITVIHLGFSTVSRTGVVDGSITTAKIADNAITSDKIAPGTVIASDIADGTVTAAKLASGAAVANIGYTPSNAAYGISKNRIINGAMMIDQRNAGASVTPAISQYTLDRWYYAVTQASKLSTQQNQGAVTPPSGFTNYLGSTSLSAYSITATDTFTIRQYIEGNNIADLGWGTANAKTVTLSFQVYSSLTGTFGGALKNASDNRSYPFSYSIPAANTWTAVSVTIAGDTTGTWLTTNGIGIQILFSLGVGSTYAGTAGSWSGSNYLSATGATSVVGTSGATFYITGVQLEVGSSATGFEYRQYGQELVLCQRYFERSYNIGTATGTPGTTSSLGTFPAANAVYFVANFKATKRINPTVVGYSPFDGSPGNYSVNNTSNVALSGSISNGTQGVILYTGTSPGNVSAYVHFTADSEL